MADRTIPQRELRNNIGAVLRAAEAGETFTITVRGKPVARLGPHWLPDEPRVDVDRETILKIMSIPMDGSFLAELRENELPMDDPWDDD